MDTSVKESVTCPVSAFKARRSCRRKVVGNAVAKSDKSAAIVVRRNVIQVSPALKSPVRPK